MDPSSVSPPDEGAGSFAGQLAVITGGAKGLGFATAELLAMRGARVVILDRNAEALSAAVARLTAAGCIVSGVEIDVGQEKRVVEVAEALHEREGPPQILVNNAGYFPFTNIMSVSEAEWEDVFAVNTKSVFLCTRAFGRQMTAAGYGRIVCVGSAGAYGPNPTLPHYAAAKAAVLSMVRTFAMEFAPHEVLVNGVSPGNIATEDSKDAQWLVERVPRIPLRRAALPSDIAEIIAFLASRRNRYIVGETIIASGGYVMV